MTIELGDDHAGDPAMWVVFHLRQEFEPDKSWVDKFSEYSTKTVIKLIDSGLSRFPHRADSVTFSLELMAHSLRLLDSKAAQSSPDGPPGVDLRRAVSASYYALFHHLSEAAVQQIAPQIFPEAGNRRWQSSRFTRAWVKSPSFEGRLSRSFRLSDRWLHFQF